MTTSEIVSRHRRIKTTGRAGRTAAAAAATGFSLLAAFQLSLALGAPLGHLAWGGAQEWYGVVPDLATVTINQRFAPDRDAAQEIRSIKLRKR